MPPIRATTDIRLFLTRLEPSLIVSGRVVIPGDQRRQELWNGGILSEAGHFGDQQK